MTGSQRSGTGFIVAVVAGSLVGLAGCTGGGESPAADGPSTTSAPASAGGSIPVPTTAASSTSPPADRTLKASNQDQVCGGWYPYNAHAVRAYDPDGPAYAGPGPHPVVLYEEGTEGYPELYSELPATWRSETPPDQTQLAVCQYDDDSYKSRKIGTCTYEGSDGNTTAEVLSARYVYRVFEARTGKMIRQFTLNGSTDAEGSCPVTDISPSSYYQKVEAEDLIKALRPLVEGTRPR